MTRRYFIEIKDRRRYFETIEAANKCASEIFRSTKIVVGVYKNRKGSRQ